MNQIQSILDLSETFDINAIFAHRVFTRVGKENLQEVENFINSKPKPFIKWVGGKRQLLKQFRLHGLYPPFDFDPSTSRYFEPFVGGGAVFFDLLPEHAVLSDLNHELVTTYNVIRANVEELILELKQHKIGKEYFLSIRDLKVSDLNDVQTASRFIYLNRTCFNGMYRVNKKGIFNVPYGRYTNPLICDEENLRNVSEVLQNVEILEQDYKAVANLAVKNDFIYFDPPYYPVSKTASFTSYTGQSFLEKEQQELRDTFVNLAERGCYVMLSNSDTKFIHDLYADLKGIRISKVNASRAINSDASKRGKVAEVVITNY